MKKIISLLIGVVCFNLGFTQPVRLNKPHYAILVPMHDESIELVEALEKKHYRNIDGIHYLEGTLKGVPVVFANTGLGKTNASLVTARLIKDYQPAYIFLAGSAGNLNPDLNNHSVVVGVRVIDADLGTLTAEGSTFPHEAYFSTPQKNDSFIPKSYLPNRVLVDVAQTLIENASENKILPGSIATSDLLPNPAAQTALLKLNQIDAVEMEGASFMQVCWLFDKECLVVRGISNNIDEDITKEDTIRAGNHATAFVQEMIGILNQLNKKAL